jgi:hypothetical protein
VKPFPSMLFDGSGFIEQANGSYRDACPDGDRLTRDARTLGTRVRLAAARTDIGSFQRLRAPPAADLFVARLRLHRRREPVLAEIHARRL